jgi:hypothetical protein
MWKMVHIKALITPDAPQSAIQYRAIVQRDRFGPEISLDPLLLETPLCSATGKVGRLDQSWCVQSISPFRPVAPLHACLASSIKMELWGFFLVKL